MAMDRKPIVLKLRIVFCQIYVIGQSKNRKLKKKNEFFVDITYNYLRV